MGKGLRLELAALISQLKTTNAMGFSPLRFMRNAINDWACGFSPCQFRRKLFNENQSGFSPPLFSTQPSTL
jgi:hypothetical protein